MDAEIAEKREPAPVQYVQPQQPAPVQYAQPQYAQPTDKQKKAAAGVGCCGAFFLLLITALSISTLAICADMYNKVADAIDGGNEVFSGRQSPMAGDNYCAAAKPGTGFANVACATLQIDQSGADVTIGATGTLAAAGGKTAANALLEPVTSITQNIDAGTDGTYTGLATTTSGSGSGMVLSVTVASNAAPQGSVTGVTVTTSGSAYAAGDTVTVASADIPGSSQDLVFTLKADDITGNTAVPIKTPYFQAGLCPVNVHWHLGAEHKSDGEYDAAGWGPSSSRRRLRGESVESAEEPTTTAAGRQLAAGSVRKGGQCHKYDSAQAMYTEPYDWKHCVGMVVGETYEVHWPHSDMGACGTPNQYQTPFYDGVFCNLNATTADAVNSAAEGTVALASTAGQIGVQAQIFTIVNDENYYYPDLMRGMIVDGDMGTQITAYTGSTTGTTRDNTDCSAYAPITWHVDRKCHLISASTFDKMCADMKTQRDDMSGDFYAHGAREVVDAQYVASNQQDISTYYKYGIKKPYLTEAERGMV